MFPALWRGATVSDTVLGLEDASLGPVGVEVPPIVVGGASDRVLAIAAAHADAWNGSSIEPALYEERVARLEQLADGRSIAKQVQLWLREVGYEGTRAAARRYEDAGADTILFVLDEEREPDAIVRLADVVR